MRSVVGGLLLALVLVAVAAVLWSEAAVARRVADAHQRLATLNYDHDDGIDEGVVGAVASAAAGCVGHRRVAASTAPRSPIGEPSIAI